MNAARDAAYLENARHHYGLSFASCIAAAANNPDIWWSGRGPR
ncbi:MAG: hypothetical protein ACK4E3_10595 [Brevundimonas sp.]